MAFEGGIPKISGQHPSQNSLKIVSFFFHYWEEENYNFLNGEII